MPVRLATTANVISSIGNSSSSEITAAISTSRRSTPLAWVVVARFLVSNVNRPFTIVGG
ncbi:hypothetical protein D9M68_864480 [compost metagenome]